MTADEFRQAIKLLRMSQAATARYLALSQRQIYRMVHGHAPVPAPVALLLRCMIVNKETPVVPPRVGKSY